MNFSFRFLSLLKPQNTHHQIKYSAHSRNQKYKIKRKIAIRCEDIVTKIRFRIAGNKNHFDRIAHLKQVPFFKFHICAVRAFCMNISRLEEQPIDIRIQSTFS